jgi:hypothetical protein
MSLAAALAALGGSAAIVSGPAEAKPTDQRESTAPDAAKPSDLIPNQILSVGENLLGFIVTKTPDGTVLADHTSHYSHSSHSSHHSSRY